MREAKRDKRDRECERKGEKGEKKREGKTDADNLNAAERRGIVRAFHRSFSSSSVRCATLTAHRKLSEGASRGALAPSRCGGGPRWVSTEPQSVTAPTTQSYSHRMDLPQPRCSVCKGDLLVDEVRGEYSAIFSCPKGHRGNQEVYVSHCYKRSCRALVDSRDPRCSFDHQSRSCRCVNGHSFDRRKSARRRA